MLHTDVLIKGGGLTRVSRDNSVTSLPVASGPSTTSSECIWSWPTATTSCSTVSVSNSTFLNSIPFAIRPSVVRFCHHRRYNAHHELNKISDKPNAIRRSFIINRIFFFSELAREKIWSRLHILPLLQAEEDRDQARRHFADKARERELLGQETKVYNTDKYVTLKRNSNLGLGTTMLTVLRCRFVRPTFVYTPSKVTQ